MTGDYERYNFWNHEMDEFLKREKIKKYNREIDKSVEEVHGGKFFTNEEVLDEIKKW